MPKYLTKLATQRTYGFIHFEVFFAYSKIQFSIHYNFNPRGIERGIVVFIIDFGRWDKFNFFFILPKIEGFLHYKTVTELIMRTRFYSQSTSRMADIV